MNKDTKTEGKILDVFRQVTRQLKAAELANKILRTDLDDLRNILIVILDDLKMNGLDELRIHKSQFRRLGDLKRIDRSWDEKAEEVVLRLKDLGEPMVIMPEGE